MDREVALILVTIGVLLALYPVAKPATAQPKAQPSLLFVQMAQKIDYKKSDAQSGVMTLYDVPAQTMFFTDRPNRVVGNVPTSAFVTKWTTDRGTGGFASNPPNAAVAVFQSDGPKTAIVELRNPRLDGNNLSYDVHVLQGISSTQPAEGVLFVTSLRLGRTTHSLRARIAIFLGRRWWQPTGASRPSFESAHVAPICRNRLS